MDTRYRLIMFVRSASEVVGFFTSQEAREIYVELMVIAKAFFSTVKLIALASYSIGLETRKHFDNWAEEYLRSLESQEASDKSAFLLNETFEPIALLAPPAQDVEAEADEAEAKVQTVEDVQPEVEEQADEPAIAPVKVEVEQVEEVEPQLTVELAEVVVEEAQPVEEVVVAAPAKKAAAKTKKTTAAKTTVKKSSRTTRKASTAITAA